MLVATVAQLLRLLTDCPQFQLSCSFSFQQAVCKRVSGSTSLGRLCTSISASCPLQQLYADHGSLLSAPVLPQCYHMSHLQQVLHFCSAAYLTFWHVSIGDFVRMCLLPGGERRHQIAGKWHCWKVAARIFGGVYQRQARSNE